MNLPFELALAAVLPALVLGIYVYRCDRVEKEPWWLLTTLAVLGMLVYVPAYFFRDWFSGWVDTLFSGSITYDLQGNATYSELWAELVHRWGVPAVTLAIVPELLKLAVMLALTLRSRHFNCLFDGVVYGVFAALGYCVGENLFYAWQGGWDVLPGHLLSTLPGHLYCGVLTGCFYTLWRLFRTAVKGEQHYAARGLIEVKKPFRSGLWFAGMLLLPAMLHAVYVLAGLFPEGVTREVFYLCNGGAFVLCMLFIRRLSRGDAYRGRFADALVDRKYPGIRDLYNDLEAELPRDEEADHG